MKTQLLGDPNPKRRRIPYGTEMHNKEYAELEKQQRLERLKAGKQARETREEEKQDTETNPIALPNQTYSFLSKEMYDELIKKAELDYDSNEHLLKLKWNEEQDRAQGSNLYIVTLANTLFRSQGIRTATQADLEQAMREGRDFRGTYEDTGAVLRSLEEPNQYLAKQLGNQLGKQELPAYIPACAMDLIQDADSPSKLGFKIIDDSQIIYAPILNSKSQLKFNNSDINLKTGFPKKVGKKGSRTLWTRNSGLSRLCLYSYLGLGSNVSDLGGSSGGGRVVIVSGEATRKNSGGTQ